MTLDKSRFSEHSFRVLRLRIKDKHAAALSKMAQDVNFVWNYVNELSFNVWRRERRFISKSEINKFTAGATWYGLNLHAQTVQSISKEFVNRRFQRKKVKLKWRTSTGSRRSLGWIPFQKLSLRYRNGQFLFACLKKPLCLWDSYDLSKYELRSGNISEDSRGRWYINISVKVLKKPKTNGKTAVGIDLGIKDFASLSTGESIESKQFYRALEPSLAAAQRAKKKRRARAIHAKIANRRNDFLQKLSARLVKEHGAIFVGNVSASSLAKTLVRKSAFDAGWSMFRTMLRYKCDDAGVWFYEIDESFSTQTCSTCGSRSGPKGLEGLGIREWQCNNCGTTHDRDVNAANVILARGHARLAEGIPAY